MKIAGPARHPAIAPRCQDRRVAQRPYHHGDLHSALLDGAERLVRERGVGQWSLRELARQLEVSPAAVYHHFASKDELVLALAARALGQLGTALERDLARSRGTGPYDRVVAIGRGYVRWALREPALFALAFGPEREYTGSPVNRSPSDLLGAELDRLVKAGHLARSARPDAELHVWSAAHGLATLATDGALARRPPRTMDALATQLVRAVLVGLAAPDAAPPRP